MKANSFALTILAVASFGIAGCSKQSSESTPPPATPSAASAASVDTSKLVAAFQTAEPAAKSAVDTAVAAIKKADYSGALKQLQAVAGIYMLTDEQQAALKDVIAKVQKAVTDAATKAAGDDSKAATDVGNALKQ